MTDYDVIIVGGRPAGSTLAARLGKRNIKTLLLERGQFPSLPAASSPIIYASTMKLLDEIGADEAEYARETPKITKLQFVGKAMQGAFPIPELAGRNYAYAIDRARFDDSLWNTAAAYPTVTARQCFHVTDLLWDGDRVAGIVGKSERGEVEEVTAKLVVGADGRFSMVARKTGAGTRDELNDHVSTLHYAYWKNLKPHNGEPGTQVAYEGEPGFGYLVMDSADNTSAVCIEGQAGLMTVEGGQTEATYIQRLQQCEPLWERLEGAEMVTKLHGMRKISNLYREPGGKGFALVGDAYHQKDPLDGQGIYNAVFTAKALAWAISDWMRGEKTWDEALEWYDETARIKTYGAYRRLVNSVRDSLYTQSESQVAIPEWLQDSLARWILEDGRMPDMMGRFLTRQIPAEVVQVMTPPVIAGAIVRGGLKDLRQRVEQRLPFWAGR